MPLQRMFIAVRLTSKSLDIVHVTLSKKRVNKLDSHTMEHMMYDLIYITLQSASVLFNEYLII